MRRSTRRRTRPELGQIPVEYPHAPPGGRYYGHYTLNDSPQRDCGRTMLAAGQHLGSPAHCQATLRCGEFLIRAQLPFPVFDLIEQWQKVVHSLL